MEKFPFGFWIFLVLLFVQMTVAQIDITEQFIDPNFLEAIYEELEIPESEPIYDTDVAEITGLFMNDRNIRNLSGIEYFLALEVLDVSENLLTELDVSKNIELMRLDVTYNRLTSLDLSNNTKLEVLSAYDNRLADLKLSNNKMLWGLAIDNNRLTSLDLSNNTELLGLDISGNQITDLNLSNNTELVEFYATGNRLADLNLSNNTKLTDLDVSGNQIASLDVSNNKMLESLVINDNRLTNIDLSKNTSLKELNISDNQLTSINLSNNTALKELDVSGNLLTNLDLSNNKKLLELNVGGNYIISTADIVGLDNLELYEFALGKQKDPQNLPKLANNAKTIKKNTSLSFAGIRNGQINLNLISGNYTIELYNVQGRMINKTNINAINGVNATGLKTNNLSKGVFILNVKQSEVSVLQHKIMVK